MSQHDMDVANQTFPDTRADLNLALKALASLSSGTTAPTTTYANQLWYETDTDTLWLRNETNTGWIALFVIDQAGAFLTLPAQARFQDGTVSLPGLTWANDPDTGFFRHGANAITGVSGGQATWRLLSGGDVRMSTSGGLDAFPAGISGNLQIHGVGVGAAAAIFRASNNVNAPALNFGKSRGTTAASLTIVQISDVLGQMNAYGADGSALVLAGNMKWLVDKTPAAGIIRAALRIDTADAAGAIQAGMVVDSDQAVLALSPNGGMGYGTGAGGSVTQATNKSTAVTINKVCGQIITASTIMVSSGIVTFTVNNSTVAATDCIEVCVASPSGGKYRAEVTGVAAGSFEVSLQNITGGSLSEAVTLNFAQLRAVAA